MIKDGQIYPADSIIMKKEAINKTFNGSKLIQQNNDVEDGDINMLQDIKTYKSKPEKSIIDKYTVAQLMIIFLIIAVLLTIIFCSTLYIRFVCFYFNCKCK